MAQTRSSLWILSRPSHPLPDLHRGKAPAIDLLWAVDATRGYLKKAQHHATHTRSPRLIPSTTLVIVVGLLQRCCIFDCAGVLCMIAAETGDDLCAGFGGATGNAPASTAIVQAQGKWGGNRRTAASRMPRTAAVAHSSPSRAITEDHVSYSRYTAMFISSWDDEIERSLVVQCPSSQ